MRKPGNSRDVLLGSIFLLCVALGLKSSSDELVGWLRGTAAESWLSQFATGNQNVHDIAVGTIVSLVIYFLVVRLPERDTRRRVRRNLQHQYDSFKEGCIRIFLGAMGQACDSTLIDALEEREQFRRFFTEPFSPGQTRWDAVANGLHAENIKSLIGEFEILIAEVRFTLIAVDVENQEIFDFLKDLANGLYRARNCSPEYDGVRSLLRLMWSLYAGWSFVEGYIKRDVVADAIGAA
jgi:hypothetical protein